MYSKIMHRFLVILFLLTMAGAARAQIVQTYDAAHLDQILAPIALYPDPLLGQVLVASTYPAQIVEATSWMNDPANAGIQGDKLTAALQQKEWDPSVKSLIVFPQLLQELNDQIDWAQEVGQSFTMQQADTLNAIQRLRAQALQAGNLQSDNTKNIITQNDSILIEPTDPHLIPLPIYGPSVYGTWPYPEAQPYSFVTPSVYAVPQPSVTVSTVFIQPYWGSMSYNWHDRRLEWNKGSSRPVVGGNAMNIQERELREAEHGREGNAPAPAPTLPQRIEQVVPVVEPTAPQHEHEHSLPAPKAFGQQPANEVPLVHAHDDEVGTPANGAITTTVGTTVPLAH